MKSTRPLTMVFPALIRLSLNYRAAAGGISIEALGSGACMKCWDEPSSISQPASAKSSRHMLTSFPRLFSVFSWSSRGLAPISAQKRVAPAMAPKVQGSCVQLPRVLRGMARRVTATIWAMRSSEIMPYFASSVCGTGIRLAAPLKAG